MNATETKKIYQARNGNRVMSVVAALTAIQAHDYTDRNWELFDGETWIPAFWKRLPARIWFQDASRTRLGPVLKIDHDEPVRFSPRPPESCSGCGEEPRHRDGMGLGLACITRGSW